MKRLEWCGGAMILAASLGMAGCQPADQAQVREEVKGVRQSMDRAAEQARQATADATLAGKVKTTLLNWKGLDAKEINVDAKGNAIVLKGDVQQPAQAELAERVALQVEGVQTVDNQLTIRVPAKSIPSMEAPQTVPTP